MNLREDKMSEEILCVSDLKRLGSAEVCAAEIEKCQEVMRKGYEPDADASVLSLDSTSRI